ncbi:uncharacterized protein BROUX77_006706 [Berkeleyomyces rouxiae]|uniref:uncharacterized protein n=1 Tax=Berkeleyomyces rouxiae TaxID=2035830 RepID=UPI003B7DF97C
MVRRKTIHSLNIDAKIVELPRDWLSNLDVDFPIHEVEKSITGPNIPAVGKIPYPKWLATVEEMLIASNTSALFVGEDLVVQTAHMIVAELY